LGSADYWLIKTDANGNIQWNKTYGGTNTDTQNAMCQANDGGFALLGGSMSFGAGGFDIWVVKTDSNGVMQWNKTYGGAKNDLGFYVIQTDDTGYAIAGVTSSFGAGSNDGWLIKTDANGNIQWNNTYGANGRDVAYSLVAASDGGYALGGYTESFGAGGQDFWIVKTDSSGAIQWNKTYGGTGNDTGMLLRQTTDGGYAIVGYTNSFGAGSTDIWLVKTDVNGIMQWNKTFGGTGIEQGIHVLQTIDGGYAIIGLTDSFGAGGQDFWFVKTDSNGVMQWDKTYGGNSTDAGWSLIQTSDGGYALAGNTESFGAGGKDFYVIKTDGDGVVPEFSSWLIPMLTLITTGFIIIKKKRLLHIR
jgi:hypothetical protein